MKHLIIILISMFLGSCNVIYKYSGYDHARLQNKVNRKMKGEYKVKVYDTKLTIYSNLDSITITNDCFDYGNNVAYFMPDGVILIRVKNCQIDTTVRRRGIHPTRDGYLLYFNKRNESFLSSIRLLKVTELLSNITLSIKR